MGLSLAGRLRRFAFDRPRAFPIVGWGGRALWGEAVADRALTPVPAPRDADLLVLCGEIPAPWDADIRALFETVTLPRAVLWLTPPWPCRPPAGLPIGVRCVPADLQRRRLRDTLLDPASPARRALLPDRPPNPWRGLGDHGQGGEGMMGGMPYGRPMAMPAEDVDDLMLDDVPTSLGPFFPGLPSGLALKLRLQGDRIRRCEGVVNHFPNQRLDRHARRRLGSEQAPLIAAALGDAAPVSVVESVRAASHLRWMADFLELAGLVGYAARLRGLGPRPRPARLQRLVAGIERSGLRRVCRRVGVIGRDAAEAHELVGPVARACGSPGDARVHDDAYAGLGFEPRLESAGDAWSRWRVRVRETLQSLTYTSAPGETATPEGPRGAFRSRHGRLITPSASMLTLVPGLVEGLEWSEAILAVASLDLDPAEAALGGRER